MKLNIIKCHGSGNDFVMLDEREKSSFSNKEELIGFIKTVCRREGPIGADGVLLVIPSKLCDARMRIFNADGTEPEMCGNGLRCVGRLVLESLSKEQVIVETMRAQYAVRNTGEISKGVRTIQVDIKSIDLNPASLPMVWGDKECLFQSIPQLSDQLHFSAVSITNPHLVSIVEKIDIDELIKAGSTANSGISILPKGVNVNFARLMGPDSMYVKTYERGVGLTASCGTGMISSSIIACIKDDTRLDKEITVYNDGGAIKTIVSKADDGSLMVSFTGNATYNYSAELDYKDGMVNILRKDSLGEDEAYQSFLQHIKKCLQA
jgi:diaminopimelate epimerase